MRTCTVEGCARQHRARGYCAAHYNKILAPDRHRTIITCAECGVEHETTRTNGRYCSLECRDAESRRRKAVVGPLPWVDQPAPEVPTPSGTRAPVRVFVQGRCAHCSTPFVAVTTTGVARYCSPRCADRATDARRRAVRGTYDPGSKWVTPAVRYAVYLRDGWVCQLCHEMVDKTLPCNDDRAPSLDHITPKASGGSNDPSNLRLAHRWCNAVRGDVDPHRLFATG